MDGGDDVVITLDGDLARRLKATSPRVSLRRQAERAVKQWLDDRDLSEARKKAAAELDAIARGPSIPWRQASFTKDL